MAGVAPFWPRFSPHFLACRRAVRAFTAPALIGLSGGPDSLALVAAAAAEGVDAHALVVDHGLQDGSQAAAQQACAAARALGVPTSIAPVHVDTHGRRGVEAAAREARYNALFARAAETNRDVWVAHTLEDQAETFLLGALRGNPAGMAAATERGPVTLIRPFLSIRRDDTVGACAELGLEPWQDPMNNDAAYRRVAIRRRIIPALSELLGGDAVPPLAGAAGRIAADQELLACLVDLSPTTDCSVLAAQPAPVRQRRILAWLHSEGVTASGAQLEQIGRMCTHWHGQGPISMGGGVSIARQEAHLACIRQPGTKR